MIEEKMVIDFEEYINDDGKFKDDVVNLCDIDAINKAVTNFFAGATTVAHHGFEIHSKNFHAKVGASISVDDIDLISLSITDAFGGSAKFSFDATLKLEMTKTNNCVVIDSRMV